MLDRLRKHGICYRLVSPLLPTDANCAELVVFTLAVK